MDSGGWYFIWSNKWYIIGFFRLVLAYSLVRVLKISLWKVAASVFTVILPSLLFAGPMIPFVVAIASLAVITLTGDEEENREWTISTWDFTKQIMPLLAPEVIVADFLIGSIHDDTELAGIIPDHWISSIFGGNSIETALINFALLAKSGNCRQLPSVSCNTG